MTPSPQFIRSATTRVAGTMKAAWSALRIAVGLTAAFRTSVSWRAEEHYPEQQPPETSHFDQFLQEATIAEAQPDSALCAETLFGLYTSWCLLSRTNPQTEGAFWAAMRRRHVRPGRNGLRMRGPAAVDYILASSPGLL